MGVRSSRRGSRPRLPGGGGCRCYQARANTNPVPGKARRPSPTRGTGRCGFGGVPSERGTLPPLCGPAGRPVKRGIFAQRNSSRQNTPEGKSGKAGIFLRFAYVNRNAYSQCMHPCGKVLWINLWRMWKTPGYQQVFLWGPMEGRGVEKSVYPSAYSALSFQNLRVTLPFRSRCRGRNQG